MMSSQEHAQVVTAPSGPASGGTVLPAAPGGGGWAERGLLWLWLAMLALHYPFVLLLPFGLVPDITGWVFFPHASVSLLSLAVILLAIRCGWWPEAGIHPVLLGAVGVLGAINLGHFLADGTQRFADLAFSLTWLSLPLAAWAQGRRLIPALPAFITFLWLVNGLHAFWQLSRGMEVIGIVLNRNWHGGFLVATTPLAMLYLRDRLNGANLALRPAVRRAIPWLAAVLAFVLLLHSWSRAAWLSLLAVGLAAMWMHCPGWRRRLGSGLVVGGVVAALTGLVFAPELADIIFSDVRIPIWRAAISLILAHPWQGVSHAGFENAIYFHMPPEYFLREHAVFHCNHPHSQLLYLGSCVGIFGMIAWLMLWTWPLGAFFRKYGRLSPFVRATGWGYLALLLHSCLDLVHFHWPTLAISALYLGVLWFQLRPGAGHEPGQTVPALPTSRRRPVLAALVLAGTLVLIAGLLAETVVQFRLSYWRQFIAEHRFRGRHAQALYRCARLAEVRPAAPALFDSAFLLMWAFSDPALALAYLERMDDTPDRTYIYSNNLRARCLVALGRRHQALPYLRREARIYPVSLVALHNLLRLERELGLEDDSRRTAARLDWALTMKGMTPADLPAVLAHPEYDLKFHRYHRDGAPPQPSP